MIQLPFARVWRDLTWPYLGAREVDRDYCEWSQRRDRLASLLQRVNALSDEEWAARPLHGDRLAYRRYVQADLAWLEDIVQSVLADAVHMSRLRRLVITHWPGAWKTDALKRVTLAAMVLLHEQGGDALDPPETAAGLRYVADGLRSMAAEFSEAEAALRATDAGGRAIDARVFADLLALDFDDQEFARFERALHRFDSEEDAA
jgi:hypothetical protein